MKTNSVKWVREGRSISRQEREEMIQEVLKGDLSKTEIWRKYTGQSREHGHILRWMRTYGYISDEIKPARKEPKSLISTSLSTPKNHKDPFELEKRIKDLEKQLEVAELKAEGYELMVEIAEKELKIPIRKKFGTK